MFIDAFRFMTPNRKEPACLTEKAKAYAKIEKSILTLETSEQLPALYSLIQNFKNIFDVSDTDPDLEGLKIMYCAVESKFQSEP